MASGVTRPEAVCTIPTPILVRQRISPTVVADVPRIKMDEREALYRLCQPQHRELGCIGPDECDRQRAIKNALKDALFQMRWFYGRHVNCDVPLRGATVRVSWFVLAECKYNVVVYWSA